MIKDIGIMAINVGAYAVHKLPKGKVKNIAGEVQKVVAIAFKK